MARFEKLTEIREKIMIGRTKKLWDAGYNSLEISKKLHRPIDQVHEWIKFVVAAEKATQ